jgi:hypothetical protein
MPIQDESGRRQFLRAAAGTAAVTIVPRHVLGGARHVAPSDKINIGFVGCGTQGLRQLMEALPKADVRIAAVCDPNRVSADYPEWGPNEIRDKVRAFLGDPSWGEGESGCRCGREIGREIVERHYRKQGQAGRTPAYGDFREMLDKEKGLDAVYVMTPDHLHATVAIAGMRRGLHAITHKPISNVFTETRLAVATSTEAKAATHLFCASGSESASTLSEWIWSGAIGPVREVHNWSSRPFWPQGMTEPPKETPPIPDGFEWDLWLGPAAARPYHPAYTHAVFRGWIDFGSGALGDMGHYSFYQIFRVLKLGRPARVEAVRSELWRIEGCLWKKQPNTLAYPQASIVRFDFPARADMPPVRLSWYDGGLRPPKPEELEVDSEEMPAEGMLFVGDRGKILAGFMGQRPRLIPKQAMVGFQPPPETLPRPLPELDQWIRACKGGPASDASFERVSAMAETICLGNVALRVGRKLEWDGEKREFTNAPEANALLRREYRPGWEL